MSANAHHRIQEIFRKSGGQNKLTETAIRTLIARDPAFLLSLVEPYLGGIIAHAIERARKEPTPRPAVKREVSPLPKKTVKAKAPSKDALKDVFDSLAKNFSDTEEAPKKQKQASQEHVKTMQAIAKKQFGKKKES